MLKNFPSDKINVTKNALFVFSPAPTHHGCTLSSQFLYELKYIVHLSKIVCGIVYFRFCLVVINFYIFVQQEAWTILL